jgi:hypothetical protein
MYMSSLNASVYAFDCTNTGKAEWQGKIEFYPWCIGRQQVMENAYTKDQKGKQFTFMSLAEIKKKLGHDHIDMLKMDVEGFEWDILQLVR